MPDGGSSQIVHDSGYDIWELFESQSAFPSTVFITHEMQVYDMMNNAGSWSMGSRMDQMLEDCGALCEGEGECSTASGDLNEDEILNIQDLIVMVNQILGSTSLEDCALEAADMNEDGIINIQDLISLVNAILGSPRSAQLNGHANIKYITNEDDMIVKIKSDVDLAGIQLSLLHNKQVDIELKDNSHITQDSHFQNGITRYLAYSMFNQPFDGKTTELMIHSAGNLDMNDIEITIADINGDALSGTHLQGNKNYYNGPHSFELSKLYPNPFNPSTEVSFSLPMDNFVRLSAYDVRGHEVDVIFEGAQSIGSHSYTWNASSLPSGVYYIHLQAGDMVTSQKALLVK